MGTMFLFYAMGIITSDKIHLLSSKPILYSAIIIYIAYLFLTYFKPNMDNLIISELGSIAGIICVFNLFRELYDTKLCLNFFLYLSKWTLSIYIYHFVLLYALMDSVNTLYEKMNNPILTISFNFILAILVTLFIGKISDFLSKSVYLRKYAFGSK